MAEDQLNTTDELRDRVRSANFAQPAWPGFSPGQARLLVEFADRVEPQDATDRRLIELGNRMRIHYPRSTLNGKATPFDARLDAARAELEVAERGLDTARAALEAKQAEAERWAQDQMRKAGQHVPAGLAHSLLAEANAMTTDARTEVELARQRRQLVKGRHSALELARCRHRALAATSFVGTEKKNGRGLFGRKK